jgi:hypothetical protein
MIGSSVMERFSPQPRPPTGCTYQPARNHSPPTHLYPPRVCPRCLGRQPCRLQRPRKRGGVYHQLLGGEPGRLELGRKKLPAGV